MANKSQTEKYLAALERLKAQGKPINNDAVAQEAGSGKGSIKKSRAGHVELYASGQLILNLHSRERMLVSTHNCVDTWTQARPSSR